MTHTVDKSTRIFLLSLFKMIHRFVFKTELQPEMHSKRCMSREENNKAFPEQYRLCCTRSIFVVTLMTFLCRTFQEKSIVWQTIHTIVFLNNAAWISTVLNWFSVMLSIFAYLARKLWPFTNFYFQSYRMWQRNFQKKTSNVATLSLH